jgi:hypothetical protein
MLFAQLVLPVLEELTSLLLTYIESKKGGMNLKIAKINKELQDIAYAEEAPLANPIGFVYTPPEDEYDEDEEE